jgi:hypothetical protein
MDDTPQTNIWPDTSLSQTEVNQPLLDREYPSSTHHQPPNTNADEIHPDDPNSPHQRYGPPDLRNWLPDSGATSHYMPIFSDLCNPQPCNVPVSLADGSTKTSTFKGTCESLLISDDGQKAVLGLTDVYYVEGLSHRLLSLTAISGTQNFTVLIQNKATTIQFPDESTFTWPPPRDELPVHQAFVAAIASTLLNRNDDEHETKAFDDDQDAGNPESPKLKSLPLELISRHLAHRNFRSLMLGSLHHAWHDHVVALTVDPNNWPLCTSVSQKQAQNTAPMRQGDEPFHCLHIDLMRNPFRIGLPIKSTISILNALKSWLTLSELLGCTQSVHRFIKTDAGSEFSSADFISICKDLGTKLEAATPEHQQEMNGSREAKWCEVHNTANILLNTAFLGRGFFHHAHSYDIHIVDACPTKNVFATDGTPITPYEFSYGQKASLTNFRVFGCPTFYKTHFNKCLITVNKQQLQCASRGIFLGFPHNSTGWLVYSPEQPQSLIITRDANFHEDSNSVLCFESSMPFAGAVPIQSYDNPADLRNIEENTEPATHHQSGSAANLGNHPSSFVDEIQHTSAPNDEDVYDDLLYLIPRTSINECNDDGPPTLPDRLPEPIPPNPHQINMTQHQQGHSSLQKQMAIFVQECDEHLPSIEDPIQPAMMTIENPPSTTDDFPRDDPVDNYLPEPQSLKAALKLDDDIQSAWLHAIHMEIKNLIDHNTFILGKQPRKDELVIPIKLVLKAKQKAIGTLDKLKARLVARGDMEKRRIKTKAKYYQEQLQQQHEDIANPNPYTMPNPIPINNIPTKPFEDTAWSPRTSSRGVKLLLSIICIFCQFLKGADFIGAHTQEKVFDRHCVKLPMEYAYHIPKHDKYFGVLCS